MNNNDDYLWDKSGEPDPEIQQLEEILGTLRYQPRPLEIPADLKSDTRPRLFSAFGPRLAPGLAIAATIAIVLLGLGLWLGLQRFQRGQAPVAKAPDTPTPGSNSGPTPQRTPDNNQNELVKGPEPQHRPGEGAPRHPLHNPLFAKNTNGRTNQLRKEAVKDPLLAEKEIQEGKAAKDQLMLALRLASAKLSFAQKKTNTSPRDAVHNQHKIG